MEFKDKDKDNRINYSKRDNFCRVSPLKSKLYYDFRGNRLTCFVFEMKTAAGIRKVTMELYVQYVGRSLNDFCARFAAKSFAVPAVHPLRYLDVIVSTLVVMLQFKVQYYQSY